MGPVHLTDDLVEILVPAREEADEEEVDVPGADDPEARLKAGLAAWPGGRDAGERKLKIFDDRLIAPALDHVTAS